MYGVLAEDESDAEVLACLLRRFLGNQRLPVRKKGYRGCGKMLADCRKDIPILEASGVTRFLICHDADRNPPEQIRQLVRSKLIELSAQYYIVVPVQEIEAWLIADEQAVAAVISTLRIKPQQSPERIDDPKEWIMRESQQSNGSPRYIPKVHNEKVAAHLRLDVVERKCPSFKTFLDALRAFEKS